jgi:hypothetical protein
MKYDELIKHFGSEADAARAMGKNRQTVNRWKKAIPLEEQVNIEVLTKGELRADLPKSIRKAA